MACGTGGWYFWQGYISASPTHLEVALLLFVRKELFSCLAVFRSSSEEIVLSVAIDLVWL